MNAIRPKIAILGAGKLGIVLAQLSLKAGYNVYLSGSGSPDAIRLSVEVLAPGAKAVSSSRAAELADITILALPLGKYHTIPKKELTGKLVIDAMNYWWEVDGEHAEFKNNIISSSEIVQSFIPDSRVVKALSHMGYHHLLDEAKPENAAGRKSIAIAGNNAPDNNTVAEFVNNLGFDPLIMGGLSKGILLEPGHDAFGANVDRATLNRLVS